MKAIGSILNVRRDRSYNIGKRSVSTELYFDTPQNYTLEKIGKNTSVAKRTFTEPMLTDAYRITLFHNF